MSTNKTEHYQLHSWEPEDDFLREEFNENFAAVDTLLKEKFDFVIGSYMGDDQRCQEINLGFRPRLLLLADRSGAFYGGMFGEANAVLNDNVKLTDTGFQAYYAAANNLIQCNGSNRSPYLYLAVKP